MSTYKLTEAYIYIYGRKQADHLANKDLCELLTEAGYNQCKRTPGLFRHATL